MDYENRLTSVTLPGGPGVTFKYDPFGRRIQKASAAGVTNYVYDGDNITEEVDAAGLVQARYAQGPGIDEPVAMLRGSNLDFFAADGLGSVTSLTDASGTIGSRYTYESFGGLLSTTGTLANPVRYTGREYDAETGMYYYRARYYQAAIGRFISEDPVDFSGGINFYTYVKNRPADQWDSFGLMVYRCKRATHFGGWLTPIDWLSRLQFTNLQHWWIRTDTKEAGLGPAGGGIPGGPGGGSSVFTTINDHTGEWQQPGVVCIPQPDVDEECVNKELELGKPEGAFVVENNCHTLVNDIFDRCRKKNPRTRPPLPHFLLLAPGVGK